ncbi:MAG: hypothetical protein QOJ67_2335 [Acidimicrobiaceae bacterium]|jgi:hypothetical protein
MTEQGQLDVGVTRPKRTAPRIGIAIGVVLFLGLYVSVLKGFRDSGEKRSAPFVFGEETLTDGVAIDATVLSVSPDKNDMTVRLAFQPQGSFADDNGAPSTDMLLSVSAGSGDVERNFDKGKLMKPSDVTLDLFNGQITSYPFDHYQAQLFVEMATKPKAATSTTGAGAGSAPTSATVTEPAEPPTLIPVTLHLFESLHGFSLQVAAAPPDPERTAVDVGLKVDRAGSTVFFSIFIMTLMWLLAIGATALALYVAVGGRKVELAMFSFLGALLFAFPTVRNTVPGSPPVGAYSDYLAFFWAEGLVATSLVVILATWVFRPQR